MSVQVLCLQYVVHHTRTEGYTLHCKNFVYLYICFICCMPTFLDTLNTNTYHCVSVAAGLFKGCGFLQIQILTPDRTQI